MMADHADERSRALHAAFGLGDAESRIANWLATWSGKSPSVTRPMIALFAGTHGVLEQIDNPHGEATLATVTRMAAGGAPVNQVCATHDIGLKVFDLALQYPVGDITGSDALDEKGSAATIGFGMEAIAGGVDLLGLAAFGQGAEVANAVMLHALYDCDPGDYLQDLPVPSTTQYVDAARKATELHAAIPSDPLEILRRFGGREHSALMGGILAARVNHVPVVLDGDSAVVVACLLYRLDGRALDHCRFAAPASNPAFGKMQTGLNVPVLNSGWSSSEDGSGAGYAMALLKSVATVHSQSVID